jgi:copper transport protein
VISPRRIGLALASGVLVVLAGASPASAHAVLEGTDPAPDTVLGSVPSSVTLTFDEAVTTLPTSIRVYAPDGSRVDDGHVLHPNGAGEQVSVGVSGSAARGTYLVSWRVIADDSHPVSGAFTFAVGNRSATPIARPERTDRTVAAMLGASRFVGYLGCALLVGGLAFLIVLWPAGRGTRRSRMLLLAGSVGLLVSATAALFLNGPYDAALGLGSIGEADLMRETLSTIFGHAMLVRLLIAFVTTAVLLDARRLGRTQGIVLAGLAVALVATFPFTGHAVAGDLRALALVSDLIHVSAMSVWLGGLAMLVAALMRSPVAELDPVVRQFSRVALACVVLLVSTGAFQAWRQVRGWAALVHTTYGRELLVKIGLVALVLLVAWFSRSWVIRSARADEADMHDVARLRRTVLAEAVIAVVVLGITSALVATEPARTAYHPTGAADLRRASSIRGATSSATGSALMATSRARGQMPGRGPAVLSVVRSASPAG